MGETVRIYVLPRTFLHAVITNITGCIYSLLYITIFKKFVFCLLPSPDSSVSAGQRSQGRGKLFYRLGNKTDR